MSTPPPSQPAVVEPAAAATSSRSPATAWLLENALLQSLNGTVWMSMLGVLAAVGSSLAMAIAGTFALCLAVPLVGWFVGIPVVGFFAFVAGMIWFAAAMAIIGAWACTAATVAAATYARRLLNGRR